VHVPGNVPGGEHKGKSMKPKPTCGTCPYFVEAEEPKHIRARENKSAWADFIVTEKAKCARWPMPVVGVTEHGFCGEHPWMPAWVEEWKETVRADVVCSMPDKSKCPNGCNHLFPHKYTDDCKPCECVSTDERYRVECIAVDEVPHG
jgi:hypothetical protein